MVPHPEGEDWQIETLHFMELAENNHLVSSANLHVGKRYVTTPGIPGKNLQLMMAGGSTVCMNMPIRQNFSPSGYMNEF